jgi:hypothetical protein
MVGSFFKRLILWEYGRATWPYDVVCVLITAFIVFAPRQWFRDQPRIPNASQITSLPSHGESAFWIEPEMVSAIPEKERLDRLGKVLTTRTGKTQHLIRIEPILDSEQEIKGYMAFARP